MRYIFLDVETTGLSRTSDILEFGAIICDENLQIIDAVNTYYRFYGEIPSSATGVHGLTSQKLEFLSDIEFYEGAQDIFSLITAPDAALIGHNIMKYDLPVICNNLANYGYNVDTKKLKIMDTLELSRIAYTGKHDLKSALLHYLAPAQKTLADIEALFKKEDIVVSKNPVSEMKLHNALFDSFCTYCLYVLMSV